MSPRLPRRTWFVPVLIIWAVLVMPPLVFTQGTGQSTTQQTPPPKPTPPPPPPPPLPSGQDGTVRVVRRNGEAVFFEALSGVAMMLGGGRGGGKLADMSMPVPPDNPLTEARIALGRRLFNEKLLSNDKSVSCATCHLAERAFTDEKSLAVGVFGRVGRRHSPSLVNRGFGRQHFWDGRAATLEAQALLPIPDPNEMDLALDAAVERLRADASYRAAFTAAFSRDITSEDMGRALATFIRTIRSGDSPYDRHAGGLPDALTAEQQQGLDIFRRKARCTFCHLEPLFTDEQFHNTGVAWNPEKQDFLDLGRFEVTKRERDKGMFKTPTLREVAITAPYMHDGSLKTLADVVDFYDQGGRKNQFITPLIRPIGLTPAEKQALIAFLQSLSGRVSR
jgi:cytochrome c peroxidase